MELFGRKGAAGLRRGLPQRALLSVCKLEGDGDDGLRDIGAESRLSRFCEGGKPSAGCFFCKVCVCVCVCVGLGTKNRCQYGPENVETDDDKNSRNSE